MKTAIGTFNGLPDLYNAVCDALAQRPYLLAELAALPSLKGQSIVNLMQVAMLLAASGQAVVYLNGNPKTDLAVPKKMNAALARHVRYNDEYQALCSPLTGSGLTTDMFERISFGVLSQAKGNVSVDEMTALVWQHVKALGRKMTREGVTLESDEENLAELRPNIEKILRSKVPVWKQLKML